MSDLPFWSLPDRAKKDFRIVVGIGKCMEQKIEGMNVKYTRLVCDDARIRKRAIVNFI